MTLTSQELIKVLVQTMGPLIDAKNKTLEINLKAYIKDQDRQLESELKTYIDNKIKNLETNIRVAIKDLRADINGKITNYEERITLLETS